MFPEAGEECGRRDETGLADQPGEVVWAWPMDGGIVAALSRLYGLFVCPVGNRDYLGARLGEALPLSVTVRPVASFRAEIYCRPDLDSGAVESVVLGRFPECSMSERSAEKHAGSKAVPDRHAGAEQ